MAEYLLIVCIYKVTYAKWEKKNLMLYIGRTHNEQNLSYSGKESDARYGFSRTIFC